MAKLKVGDIVQLRSGGPDMTVQSLMADGQVSCVWFVELDSGGYDGPRAFLFPADSLEKIDD